MDSCLRQRSQMWSEHELPQSEYKFSKPSPLSSLIVTIEISERRIFCYNFERDVGAFWSFKVSFAVWKVNSLFWHFFSFLHFIGVFYYIYFFATDGKACIFQNHSTFSVTFLNIIEFGKGQQVNRTFQKMLIICEKQRKKSIFYFKINVCWYFNDYAHHLKM